jgi:hypothetical protein
VVVIAIKHVQIRGKEVEPMRHLGLSLVSMGLVVLGLASCGSQDESEGLLGTRLVINEVVPRNADGPPRDEFGETDDWIELYNGNDFALRLGGYFLSDDRDDTLKSELPDELVIEPLGFFVLWADGQPEQGPTHLDFKLSSTNDRGVFLSDPSGRLVDHVALQPAAADESFARIPDGTGAVRLCYLGTPNHGNVCWRGDYLDAGAGGSTSDGEGGQP